MKDQFTAAEFMDGRNSRTDRMREDYCKYAGCKHRKKHKCDKYKCRIVNAPCDPVAVYMGQKEGNK